MTTRKQTDRQTYTCVLQCSHASVGLAQPCPNEKSTTCVGLAQADPNNMIECNVM